MQIESLYPYIVPLTFLAIWALTSLFNRDAQPLPPRPGRAPGTGTGGPSPVGVSGPARPAGPSPVRPPSLARSGVTIRSITREENGVFIIETEPRRAGAGAGVSPRPAAPAARRAAKPRVPPSGPENADPAKKLVLGGPLDRPARPPVDQPQALTPLSLPASPLTAPSTLATPETPSTRPAEPGGDRTGELRALLASRQQVRDSLIVSELLAPPLSLRRGPLARR